MKTYVKTRSSLLCMKPYYDHDAENANIDETEDATNRQMTFHSINQKAYPGQMRRHTARNKRLHHTLYF